MRSHAIENKSYWLKHIESYNASGLNKNRYCNQHDIAYHRFLYWFEKLDKKTSRPSANNKTNQFIPIKEARAITPKNLKPTEALCILELKQGHRLLVHNEAILEKLFLLLGE